MVALNGALKSLLKVAAVHVMRIPAAITILESFSLS